MTTNKSGNQMKNSNDKFYKVDNFLTTDPANKRGQVGVEIKREGDVITLLFEDDTEGQYAENTLFRHVTKNQFIKYLHHHGIRWFKITESAGNFDAILHPEEKPDLDNFSRVYQENGRPVVLLTKKDFFNEAITKGFFGDEN